jgi:uncharacterized membrane protein HdeD (DUF308 family)
MQQKRKKFRTWWLLMAVGAIFIGIGVFAFISPFSSYVRLVKYTGIGLWLNGGFLLAVSAIIKKYVRERKWMQAESILHFLFAILLTFNPLLSFIALPYFIGSWIFLVGCLKIVAALSLRKIVRGWPFIFVIGVLSVVFGILLLYGPLAKANSITFLIGTFGLIMGSLYVVDAFRYRNREETLNMML